MQRAAIPNTARCICQRSTLRLALQRAVFLALAEDDTERDVYERVVHAVLPCLVLGRKGLSKLQTDSFLKQGKTIVAC